MHPPNLLFALVLVAALGVPAASAQPALGAQGAEGAPHRLQQWRVPTPDPATAAASAALAGRTSIRVVLMT